MNRAISILFSISMLFLLTLVYYPNTRLATKATDIYLRNPDDIAVITNGEDTSVYVYDKGDNHIKFYDLDEMGKSTSPSATTDQSINLLDLKTEGNNVYALINQGSNNIIAKLNIEDNIINLVEMPSSVALPNAIAFSCLRDNFYVLLSTGQLEYFTNIEGSLSFLKTIHWSHLSIGTTQQPVLLDVESTENYIYLTTQNSIYQCDISEDTPYPASPFYSSEENINSIVKTGSKILVGHSNKIISIDENNPDSSEQYTVNTDLYSLTNLAVNDDIIYYSDYTNHQILCIDIETSNNTTIAISNYQIIPNIYPSGSIKIGTTKQECLLQILPYTTTDSISLDADVDVVIMSEDEDFANHYYIMLSNGQENRFGYIQKSNVQINPKTIVSESVMTYADATKVYKYPSLALNGINSIITTLPANTLLTRTCSLNYKTQNGNTFSEIKLNDGTTGYVENTRLTVPVAAKTMALKANAKIKAITKLYSDAEGNDEIMEVSAGTRVYIEGNLIRSNKYTKIKFNLQSGEEISGYVLTSDINPDSLTLMQVIGIVLVGINMVFLVLILLLKKRIM